MGSRVDLTRTHIQRAHGRAVTRKKIMKKPLARAEAKLSERRRRQAGGVPVRSSARWIHKRYADEARQKINAAARRIVEQIIADHPDAAVSARNAETQSDA